MPVLVAIVAVIVAAAAWSIGKQLGTDAAPLLAVVAPIAGALVAFLGLWLWHRRKSHELIVARYHLKGDALGWRRVNLHTNSQARVCSECGALVTDYKSQEEHAGWHMELAELLEQLEANRKPAEPEPPWSAVAEPDPDELVPADAPPSPPRADAEQLEAAERDQLVQIGATGQFETDDEPGEWEARAIRFRAGMKRVLANTGRERDDDGTT